MENPSKDIQHFDQSRLKELISQLETFELEYKSRLRKAKINIQKLVSCALAGIVSAFFYFIYIKSLGIAMSILLIGSISLAISTIFSFSNLEYFSKKIPQLLQKCQQAQDECEDLLCKLIEQHHVLGLNSILDKTVIKESSLTALMASLVQSKRLVEHLNINTAEYVYAKDESFFLAMKESENNTSSNYSDLVSKIQKRRYELDSKYVEHFDCVKSHKAIGFSQTTIKFTILGIISFFIFPIEVCLFFFTFGFLYKGLKGALNHERLHQNLDNKQLSETFLEKSIENCHLDLENLILLTISNNPNLTLQEMDELLKLGSCHLQDLLNDLVQSQKVIEDIDVESGLSTYSICNDYFVLSTKQDLENDIFNRYLSSLNN
ncbi:MAG: hypothetical protein KC646_03980 [Candidatus Cloacimonetes bacterium]|nr:hypothetical protein [Candidatus Cloacimonadota bacterium]